MKRRSKEPELIKLLRALPFRLSSVASCFAPIVGLSFAMPDIAENFPDDTLGYYAMTASVFQDGGTIGNIVIGLLAFILGVCVTALCYQTRRAEREVKAEKTQRENDDD